VSSSLFPCPSCCRPLSSASTERSKVFDSVIALTNGGPGTSTTPLTLYMFQESFTYGNYGYGAAIATLLSLLCLVATLFIFVSTRRDLRKA